MAMLTSPLQENDTIVVVALGGGGTRHPAWYLNVLETPDVTVRWKGDARRPMIASIAGEDTRDRMWQIITESFPDYATWQSKTDRQLPLVLLDAKQ